MKYSLLVFLSLLVLVKCHKFTSTLGHIKPQATENDQTAAALDLIKRILPQRYGDFEVKIDEDLGEGKDTFRLENIDGKIRITATTGVVAAAGFNYYLKYYCNSHIAWELSLVNVPEVLPNVNKTITLNDKFRYYQNVCTTGYSFTWWSWAQWEKHIDWMALNGFNLVLAFNGQEAIWDRVYQKLNLTKEDIDEQFSGPAFLPWLRMGNLRGWGGPLSSAWHERSLQLQKLIVSRMRSLGIITVLPAFAGHLPRAFKRLYPNVNMIKMNVWNNFNDTYCCPYFLEPTEELFNTIGTLFLQEQISEFGTDHVYNCDSFNEVDPSTTDLTYLSNVGKSIFKAMTDVDKDAIWLMQGWLFVHSFFYWTHARAKALLTSVPKGKMIVLDLQSEEFPQYERLDQYFGQPYIWCMLHNFGGTLGMFGSVDILNQRPIDARNSENSTMIGTGITMEGINQNYVIYEFMIENMWRQEPVNKSQWFNDYARRRYGKDNAIASKAWSILMDSVYNFKGLERIRGHYAITRSPRNNIETWSWYKSTYLYLAWDYMVAAADDLKESPGFLHDLVDITREVLQSNGDHYYNQMKQNLENRDLESFNLTASIFMRIFDDMQDILGSSPDFLLGKWIEDAKACANDSEEEKQFEYNARNQITLWGPDGEILDYANKQWAGVMSDYFGPRWQLFVDYAVEVLSTNSTFSNRYIQNKVFVEVEEPFTFDTKEVPSEPQGDTVEIAKRIHNRWWRLLKDVEIYGSESPNRRIGEVKKGNRSRLRQQKCSDASHITVQSSSVPRSTVG
ncbi:alpha-N-acetylglucosaminidase isoform X2 [Aethina tumida]|uniref:alpha-N-acetylglucosaminidase isoform X2 n=1 Tax=Aethina tumida TaxID=116153 RepID=UPI002147B566|nr:alpha-N-acetylglucosaminidase isoform X2 [Aethina tumida]